MVFEWLWAESVQSDIRTQQQLSHEVLRDLKKAGRFLSLQGGCVHTQATQNDVQHIKVLFYIR